MYNNKGYKYILFLNYTMERQLSRRAFLGNTGKIIVGTSLLGKLLERSAKASSGNDYGFLKIQNYVDSIIGTSPLEIQAYDGPSVSDDYDGSDMKIILPTSGRCSIYSDIETHKLRRDSRQPSSETPFNTKFVYNGTLAVPKEDFLEFILPYGPDWEFGSKPIIFTSDRLKYGTRVDIRDAIAHNEGIVELLDLPVGSYNPNNPYGSGTLYIGTQLLADLDGSGGVDSFDYEKMARDFGKAPDNKYVGDITGPDGVPDGVVDNFDVGRLGDDWIM